MSMNPVAAPTDRQFRRVRVKPARRRSWRRRGMAAAKYLLLALVLYGAYRGAGLVVHARMLRVERIVVKGNRWLSTGEVLAILGGMKGEGILWTDLDAWRGRLLSSAWVRDGVLRRSLPSTVEVAVSEREPIGIARLESDLYLIDERGVIIDQYGPKYADFDLPIIDGIAARPGSSGAAADEERASLAARLIAAVQPEPEVARRVSQINVADRHNAAVILNADGALIHVGEDDFLPRLRSYFDVAAALRDRVPEIESVDLRFDGRIYVRPAGQARAVVVAR